MSLIFNSALRISHRYITCLSRFQLYACINQRLTLFKVQPRLIHVSSLQCKKKVAKSPSSKKNTADAIDRLLDELSDDENEDEDLLESKMKTKRNINHDSPVNKFLTSKQKGVKSKAALGVTYADVCAVVDIDEIWQSMEEIVKDLQHHFMHHVTLRSASAIDQLPIEFEGEEYPLGEIADISKVDPKRVVIDCSSIPQASKSIMEALTDRKSMNLNPQQEGTRIYVPVPKVTKDTRKSLAKSAGAYMNDALEKLRKLSNKAIAGANENENSCSADQVKGSQEVIRVIESHFANNIRQMTDTKQKDLLNK